MKIAVCFKIVPDYEEAAPSTWENIDVMDFTYVKKIYGCFDEAALETGLKLKDSIQAAGRSVETLAVTVGGGPEVLLQGLFAAGFDRVVTIAQEAGKPPETGERQEVKKPGGIRRHFLVWNVMERLKASCGKTDCGCAIKCTAPTERAGIHWIRWMPHRMRQAVMTSL